MSRTSTFRHRGKTYFVEAVEGRGDELLRARFILRGPRGTSYALIAAADHSELLFAVNPRAFRRRTPFDAISFRVEDGKLIIVDPTK